MLHKSIVWSLLAAIVLPLMVLSTGCTTHKKEVVVEHDHGPPPHEWHDHHDDHWDHDHDDHH